MHVDECQAESTPVHVLDSQEVVHAADEVVDGALELLPHHLLVGPVEAHSHHPVQHEHHHELAQEPHQLVVPVDAGVTVLVEAGPARVANGAVVLQLRVTHVAARRADVVG